MFLLQVLAFLPLALFRLLDADEGYYALAAKLVMQGELPYRDFLYIQMPLLPYAYGAWMAAVGRTWYAARTLSVLCAALIGTLMYAHIVRRGDGQRAARAAVGLYAFAGLSFGWLTTVKTYALSALLLFAAYVVLTSTRTMYGRLTCALAGLLLGLAVGTRLLVVAVIPAFLFELVRGDVQPEARRGALLAFLAGLAAGLSFILPFALVGPDNFWFDNLRFHSIRISSRGLFGDADQKLAILAGLFDVSGPGAAGTVQFILLVGLALYALAVGAFARTRLACFITLAIIVVSVLPSPSFVQYFALAVPFLAVVGVAAFSDHRSRTRPAEIRRRWGWGIATLALVYFGAAPFEAYRYTTSGRDVPGIAGPSDAVNWRITTVDRVAAEIRARAGADDVVFAWWPGYLLTLDQPRLAKTETHFGLEISDRLSQAERERYRILSHQELARAIAAHTPRFVIVGSWVFRPQYEKLLGESGYRSVFALGSTKLYAAP